MHLTRSLIPGLLAGTLLLGTVSGTFAAGKHAARPANAAFAVGKVSKLQAGSFTLTWTPRVPKGSTTTPVPKSITVTVTAATKETAHNGTTGPLANGEYAAVFGTKTADGIAAMRVEYSSTAFNGAGHHRGHSRNHAIGAVDLSKTTATSLLITNRAGKGLTFVLNANTKYVVNKVVSNKAPTFTNGERVAVLYSVDQTTKALTALAVVVVPTKPAKA